MYLRVCLHCIIVGMCLASVSNLPCVWIRPVLANQPGQQSNAAFSDKSDSSDDIDCGTSSVYLLLRALSNDHSSKFLKADHGRARPGGRSMLEVREMLEANGVPSVSLRCNMQALLSLKGPYIAHWHLDPAGVRGHYVMVKPAPDGAWVFDPMMKKPIHTSLSAGSPFDRLFSGNIVAPHASVPDETSESVWPAVAVGALIIPIVILSLTLVRRFATTKSAGTGLVGVPARRLSALLLTLSLAGCDPPDGAPYSIKRHPDKVRLGAIEFLSGLDIDFGEVPHSRELVFTMPIRNAGRAPADLSDIENRRPCCFRGYVTANPEILGPGETGLLELRYENGVRAGRLTGVCELAFPNATDVLNDQELVINFSYKTTGNATVFRVNTDQIDFGTIDISTDRVERSRQIELQVDRDSENYPGDVTVALDQYREGVSVDLGAPAASTARSGQDIWSLPVRLRIDPSATPLSEITGRVIMSGNGRSASVRYTANVIDGYSVSPHAKLVMVTKEGVLLNNEIVVSGGNNRRAVVRTGIRCPRGLTAVTTETSPSEVKIRLALVENHPSMLDGSVEFFVCDEKGFERGYVLPLQLISL